MIKISFFDLSWIFILAIFSSFFYIKFTLDKKSVFIAIFRMILQLVFIGYTLVFIFHSNSSFVLFGVLFLMVFFASLISLRPLENEKKRLYFKYSFFSIAIGGGMSLFVTIFFVLKHSFLGENLRIIIPLSGMVFANTMNAISLFVKSYEENKNIKSSLKTALIPTLNSFYAVGLVSLPGMMSGQILSGVEPLVAVRYQIMVMLMILSSNMISLSIFVTFLNKKIKKL